MTMAWDKKTLPMAGEIVEASEAVKTDSAKNAEDLLNNPLASDPLCCQTNRQTEHCNPAIQLFRKDLCGIRGVGHGEMKMFDQCKEM